MRLQYAVQPKPEGLAQAFLIGRDFIGADSVALVLGDNLFFGHGLQDLLQSAARRSEGATIFAYQVRDPERYGVVAFDSAGRASKIEEKPKQAVSNWAVTGLYFYDNQVVRYASEVKPSGRGEFEITDVNARYLSDKTLHVEKMGRGFAWLDTGTFDSLIEAASFVQTLEQRQGMKICCPEEIAYRMGFITRAQLIELSRLLGKSGYGDYLVRLVEAEIHLAKTSEALVLRAVGNCFRLSVIGTRLFPKLPSERQGIDVERFPPGNLIAGLMKLPVMTATERDGELVADFKTDGSGLRKSQMMRVGRLPPANQTGL